MKGKIISWDRKKQYGFIKDKNNNTYFLHKSEVKNKKSLQDFKINKVVFFKEKATEKGMRAIEVKLDTTVKHFKKVLDDSFVIRKKGKPRGELIYTGKLESQWNKDIEKTKEELIALAKKLGFNCLYNLEMVKEKRTSGNYKYSVFAFNAEVGLLAQKVKCKNKNDTLDADKELDLIKKEVEKNYNEAIEDSLRRNRTLFSFMSSLFNIN